MKITNDFDFLRLLFVIIVIHSYSFVTLSHKEFFLNCFYYTVIDFFIISGLFDFFELRFCRETIFIT